MQEFQTITGAAFKTLPMVNKEEFFLDSTVFYLGKKYTRRGVQYQTVLSRSSFTGEYTPVNSIIIEEATL